MQELFSKNYGFFLISFYMLWSVENQGGMGEGVAEIERFIYNKTDYRVLFKRNRSPTAVVCNGDDVKNIAQEKGGTKDEWKKL